MQDPNNNLQKIQPIHIHIQQNPRGKNLFVHMKESRMLQFLLRESYMYLTKKNVPPKRVTCKAFHSIEPIFTFSFQRTTDYQSRIQDHSINSRSTNLQLIYSHQTHQKPTKLYNKKNNSKQNHTFFFLSFPLFNKHKDPNFMIF